jgi:hypothetical protein
VLPKKVAFDVIPLGFEGMTRASLASFILNWNLSLIIKKHFKEFKMLCQVSSVH